MHKEDIKQHCYVTIFCMFPIIIPLLVLLLQWRSKGHVLGLRAVYVQHSIVWGQTRAYTVLITGLKLALV